MYQQLMTSIWDSLRLFRNNLITLIAIVLPFVIILEAVEAYYVANYVTEEFMYQDLLPLFIIKLLIQPFYTVAIIFYLNSIISNDIMSFTQAWSFGLRYWSRYFLLSLSIFFLIVAGVSLILVILPIFDFLAVVIFIFGIVLFIRLSFSQFHLLLEQCNIFESIKQSIHSTNDYFRFLILGYIIFGIMIYLPYFVITNWISAGSNEINIFNILISIIFEVATLLFIIFTFRIYQMSQQQH